MGAVSARWLVTSSLGLFCVNAFGQALMPSSGSGGLVRIYGTDSAVLEAREPRKDLPCSVVPVKPFLGFDLKFHAGYEISIPLKELSGSEDLLTIIFRVTPAGSDRTAYFSQKISVPAIEEDAKGNAFLQGNFDVGEGKYQVDLLIRDRAERVCSDYWESEAVLPAKDKDLNMVIAPSAIQASDKEPFKEEPPIDRDKETKPFNVKVLINFAPQNSNAASMQPTDTNALVSILRNIAREPKIGSFSLVAFNMQEQKVLYRQDTADQIDFPSLGDAVDKMKLGVVDVRKLSEKNAETLFLTDLITRELTGKERPDAVIFAGPKVMLDQPVPEDTLRQLGAPEYPVFYMNYNFNPQANPWRDAIGNAVKFFKGQEFTISRPRDLWFAWTEIMSRIVRTKGGRHDTASHD
ncbi:MAG: acetyltransferase [Bryobacteraceae bacterium]